MFLKRNLFLFLSLFYLYLSYWKDGKSLNNNNNNTCLLNQIIILIFLAFDCFCISDFKKANEMLFWQDFKYLMNFVNLKYSYWMQDIQCKIYKIQSCNVYFAGPAFIFIRASLSSINFEQLVDMSVHYKYM